MGVDDELLGELQARAKATAGDFKLQDVVRFMVALAKMGVKTPDAGLVEAMQVDIILPGKGNLNSHGARPVCQNHLDDKWIRTSRLSIKNSLSAGTRDGDGARL
jgi:hypothetical protein